MGHITTAATTLKMMTPIAVDTVVICYMPINKSAQTQNKSNRKK
jgi:hypothetical protein